MPSRDGPTLKLRRANEHLLTFEREAYAFLHADPRPFRAERRSQLPNRGVGWFAKIEQPVPPRLGLVLGDAIHNMRAALDHLAWQLALLTTDAPSNTTEFPIYLDPTEFRRNRERKIGALPAAAQELIENKQPFRADAPERTFIWLLHSLDIVDKHRLIPFVAARPTGIAGLPPGVLKHPETRWFPGGVVAEGDLLFGIGDELAVAMDARDEPTIWFDIALAAPGPAQGLRVADVLRTIHDSVRDDVISSFADFFEDTD